MRVAKDLDLSSRDVLSPTFLLPKDESSRVFEERNGNAEGRREARTTGT